jgi:hypothetical protein
MRWESGPVGKDLGRRTSKRVCRPLLHGNEDQEHINTQRELWPSKNHEGESGRVDTLL